MSLAIIVAVGAVVVGATGAFFSDTETSTGNTFTAGAIDLKVDSQQHYNGNNCVDNKWVGDALWPVVGSDCGGTWGQEDLNQDQSPDGLDVTNQRFFNLDDMKPGDFGENTISLHVDNNDAWACAKITITSDEDNSCTEPENEAMDGEDGGCVENDSNDTPAFNGEMRDNLSLAWWPDNGDNIMQTGDEFNNKFFISGAKLSDMLANSNDGKTLLLTLADSATNFFTGVHNGNDTPMAGGETKYVGFAWCFGDMEIANDATITCNGEPIDNSTQTDSLTADLEFYVEQARHNGNFLCEDSFRDDSPVLPAVGARFSEYVSPDNCILTVGSEAIDTIQNGVDQATDGDVVCVLPGVYDENVVINKNITVVAMNAPDSTSKSTITGRVDLTVDGAVLRGFDVVPGVVPAREAGITTTANNTTIDSNIVSGMSSTAGESIKGIYIYKGSAPALNGNTVTNNYIHDISNSAKGTYGVMVQGEVDNTTVTYNTIEDLSTGGWNAVGIEVTPTGSVDYSPKNVVIQYNHIENMENGTSPGIAVTVDWYDGGSSQQWVTDASEVTLSYNNFVGSDIDVRVIDPVHTLAAPNNWWGDMTPDTVGLVDSNPLATGEYPHN